MNIPNELKYTKSHEWVRFLESGNAQIGLTDFAQQELGDVVFLNLPEEGDQVELEESFADVESVKAVSDIFSPLSGTVAASNQPLADAPELINSDPYGSWLIEVSGITEQGDLLDAADYQALCEEA